jgi:hypothetical protein
LYPILLIGQSKNYDLDYFQLNLNFAVDCNSTYNMKTDKLTDAFKAFKVKNKEDIKGGFYTVTYQNGHGVCDLMDSTTGQDLCNRKDTGPVGTTYK